MSALISITELSPWNGVLPWSLGNATSQAALDTRRVASSVVGQASESQALYGKKSDAISELMKLYNECSEPDWDGYGSCALSEMAVRNAEAFIFALPDDVSLPEFAPEPSGFISLDWIHSQRCMFSMSMGTNNRLACAWIDGSNRGHALESFSDGRISPGVIDSIRRVDNRNKAIKRSY